jgi:hypothetical protein
MMHRFAVSVLSGLMVVVPSQLFAAPPPPPPPGAFQKATAIAIQPKEDGLADYTKLFADDVVVLEGDKKVASDRAGFLTYLRARARLHQKVLHLSIGNPILVVETISDFPEHPPAGVFYDCCYWARIASYHLDSSGKVDRVLFLQNGSYWGAPER